VITENVYWQSQVPDDVGPPANDAAFDTRQVSWADMTALNYLPKPALGITATPDDSNEGGVTVRLHNPSTQIAFFQRAELLTAADGDEILPISYDDNYITVFPGETAEIGGHVPSPGPKPTWVRVTGYGGASTVVPVR
jgi:exo-1,4-beta-D-glucosaminidase